MNGKSLKMKKLSTLTDDIKMIFELQDVTLLVSSNLEFNTLRFRHLYRAVFFRSKCFNLFFHPGRIFVITGDCFVRNKIFKDIYNRFVENRNLFIHIKIRKTFPSQIIQSLI